MKKSVYYWSPFISKVGTVKSTLNSACSLAKYSQNYDVRIINVFGEWSEYQNKIEENGVKLENLTFNYSSILPYKGFLKSRFTYILIILISIIPLAILLIKKKPDYFIAHLITSLPLVLFNLLKTKTKLVLRISGHPKLNFFRKKLWTRSSNKIFKVTSPTNELLKDLIVSKIFQSEKLKLLPDAIINLKEIIDYQKKSNSDKFFTENSDYFLAAGRFTKQKNFLFLIKEFKKFCNQKPNEKLFLIGEGELKEKIEIEIRKNNLQNNIKIIGFTNNIYRYMKKSKAFLLTSLWEEVGFVIVEAAMCNSLVISSNCKNGPKEFLSNGDAGLLFENNVENKLYEKLIEFSKLDNSKIIKKKILAKKNCNKFTGFRHFRKLTEVIEDM